MRRISVVSLAATGCMAMGGAHKSAMAPPSAGMAYGTDAAPQIATKEHEETWKRSQIVPNSSRLMVGDREQLPLQSMQTRVTIDGFRARVVTDYVYSNDRGQQLEGNFQLRLPEEASPYFFAFGESTFTARTSGPPMVIAVSDTGDGAPQQVMAAREQSWRNPREARMVPREKAQIAYGATVRQRVDPAIVEWAGAGVFNARVFPLAPHTLQRVVVGYDVDLVRIGDGLEYRFDLPPNVPASSIDVAVVNGTPAVVSPQTTGASDARRTYYHFDKIDDDHVTVKLPGAAATIAGSDGTVGDLFASQVVPQLPRDVANGTLDTAVFMVDTSLSSNPDRFNIYLKLLRTVLDQNRDSLKRFGVLFFGVDASWYRTAWIENTPANVDALLTYANELALEGATDLGSALAEAAHPAWLPGSAPYDVFLLSDGAATWGEANLHALARTFGEGHALFAYQTGLVGTDVAALAKLTRESGGAIFSVTGESEVARAATAHRTRPWRLLDANVVGGHDILLAGRPRSLFAGQKLTVVGRGTLRPDATLVLTLERDGVKKIVRTPLGAPIPSALAVRAYGQIATDQLEELEAATEHASKAYAQHFRVTGRTCSLLMLQTDAEYQRFNLDPRYDESVVAATPAGRAYDEVIARAVKTLGDPKAAFLAHLDRLAGMPEIRMHLSPDYRRLVEQLPPSAFEVAAPPLVTHAVTKQQVVRFADMYAKHQLDYDLISVEADRRRGALGPGDALKALSSLVEDNPGDAVLARDVGFSAMDLGLRGQAYQLFRRVAEARPHEPQTYRAMAQALAQMGKTELALAYYEIPLQAEWDPRFGDLHTIVELDYLHFLRTIENGAGPFAAYARARRDTLARTVGITRADVVVSITWNTDNTDVDLHVTEPSGEECFYQHRTTNAGGTLTHDVTQGYGPEMYVLPNAPRGSYRVRAHYYASDRNRTSARSKVYATVIRDWGTPREQVTERVVTLEMGKDMHDIAAFDVGAADRAIRAR